MSCSFRKKMVPEIPKFSSPFLTRMLGVPAKAANRRGFVEGLNQSSIFGNQVMPVEKDLFYKADQNPDPYFPKKQTLNLKKKQTQYQK